MMAEKAVTRDDFPYHTRITVRGYELDSYGHANNAAYLNWLEHARWELFREHRLHELLGGLQTVLRHADLDFRAETFHGDTLRITLFPRRVGNTSFTIGSMIRIVEAADTARVGKLALVASSTLVCTSPNGDKARVPDAIRALFPEEDPGPMLTGASVVKDAGDAE